ncbi:MAG TPA: NADH-quinone oxidoreductase subunit J [Anaerolineae bacterium]
MDQIVFYVFALLAVLGALGVPYFRNPVHSALSLAATFISLAAIYVLLNAPFIAAAQVLIYAGAILILFLFVTMLLNPDLEIGEGRLPGMRWIAAVVGVLIIAIFGGVLGTLTLAPVLGKYTPEFVAQAGHTQIIGTLLFGDFLLPFEITSLLLLLAIVGTMVMARKSQ